MAGVAHHADERASLDRRHRATGKAHHKDAPAGFGGAHGLDEKIAAHRIIDDIRPAHGLDPVVKVTFGAVDRRVRPGGAGDGLVMVEVASHPFYKREGDNIRMDLPITLDEALNGAKVKCPTVDGPVMLTIKPGTNGGTVMRLKGKGWNKKNGDRGDQLVTLEIQMPGDLEELAKRLEGWKDESNPRSDLGV